MWCGKSAAYVQVGKQLFLFHSSVRHITCSLNLKMHLNRFVQLARRLNVVPMRTYTANTATAAAGSADKLNKPPPEGTDKVLNPKLDNIVNSIAGLNLLEVSELSALLKKKLNLSDAVFAPQMAAGAPRAASSEEDDEESAPKKVQTSFKVKLVKFDEKQKVALIKEVKNLLEGMNLVQAKKFVESAPTFVKEDIPKEEAEKLKDALCKVGAVVEIE